MNLHHARKQIELHDAIDDHFKALVQLCPETSLRQREVFGPTADRVEFLRGVVTLDPQSMALPVESSTSSICEIQRSHGRSRLHRPLGIWPVIESPFRLRQGLG